MNNDTNLLYGINPSWSHTLRGRKLILRIHAHNAGILAELYGLDVLPGHNLAVRQAPQGTVSCNPRKLQKDAETSKNLLSLQSEFMQLVRLYSKPHLQSPQPSRESLSTKNARDKSYTKRSVKTRPLSDSPASSRKRSSAA